MRIKKASPGLDQRNLLGRLLGPEFMVEDYDSSRPLVDQVTDAVVLLIRDIPIGADVIAAAPKLRLIQRPGAHVVGVDYDAAQARLIPVSRFPSEVQGQPARDVAEHAFFLMLAIAKKYRGALEAIQARRAGLPKTVRLCGKTLALIGVGATGTELAKLAKGFGMRVIAIKRTPDPALAARLGLDFLGDIGDLEHVLGEADVVSLHLPNNASTRSFIGRREFGWMKPGALFVNIARAPMVDKAALEAALSSGRLGGAGLDVCWQEPIDPGDRLINLPNVVITPHIAGDTEGTEQRLAELTAANIIRIHRGGKPHFVIGVDVDPL